MHPPQPPPTGIARFIPGLALIRGFNPALLRSELIVAVTVFAVLVPSAMAYGDLAGVTPVAGLYVALGAMVMYALFGTSKQLIMGPEAISDFDSTAAEALENLDANLERLGVEFWIARANEPLREFLTATGLTKRLGSEHIYPSVRAAVTAYRAPMGAP